MFFISVLFLASSEYVGRTEKTSMFGFPWQKISFVATTEAPLASSKDVINFASIDPMGGRCTLNVKE